MELAFLLLIQMKDGNITLSWLRTTGMFTALLFTEATLENIAAAEAGIALPNILTTGFSSLFGAAGNWLACCVILIFICKREDLKVIGRLLVCSGGYTSSTVARRIAEYIETNRLLYEVKKHQCGGRPAALPEIRSDSSGAAGLFCL